MISQESAPLDDDENSDVEGEPGMKKCRHCGKQFTN